MLKKGQRVLLKKFGWGTVLSFELIVLGAKTPITMVDNDPGEGRVLVELDEPELWIGATKDHPHPYMMRSDILDSHKCRACAWRGKIHQDDNCPNCGSELVEEIEP